jgi:hypothetical protein
MQLIAAILPMVIALGTAVLGLAAAMGTVAAAGAGMVGLGLMGFEDTEKRIKKFKEELRTVFDPLTKAFKPIADSFLSQLPSMLSDVAAEMKNLPVFKDTFFQAVRTLIGAVENLIQNFVALEPIISQLTERFTGMIASGIVDFLTWLVKEAYRNQDAMVDLGRIFAKIIAIIYKLSKVLSSLVINFEFVLDAILAVAEGLQNDFAMGFLKAISYAYALGKALKAIDAILKASLLGKFLSVGAIALTALTGFLGASGNGRNAMGSGRQTPSNMPGSGSGDTYYVMNVEGDTRDSHMSQFRNMNPDRYHTEEEARK